MPKKFTYNVYDRGELILENVTRVEINKALRMVVPNQLVHYAERGHKYLDRYTFEFANLSELAEGDADAEFIKEWTEAVKPFKRVIWVKEGGRKLRIGGKE